MVAQARKIAQRASSTRDDAKLVEVDESEYDRLYSTVQQASVQLRVVLEGAEAREKERVWLKNQTQGELDDARLVDGIVGETNIFKRRGDEDPLFGRIQRLPKRLIFLVDVSSSMAKRNGDRRLDRLCAATIMLMEALHGQEHKYDYAVVGHSGESDAISFVDFGKPPRDRKSRLQVIRQMYSHAVFCSSGDNTVSALVRGIQAVAAEEADDYFAFLVSDANLRMYGIRGEVLASVLGSDPKVNALAVFIGGEDQAEELRATIPAGKAHVLLDTRELPSLFKSVLSAALVKSRI